MKNIEELKNIIDRFYVKYSAVSGEVEDILQSCGASEDDSSDEGYFSGMTDSQIETCYSKIRDLIKYRHENINPDYFTEDTLVDFDLQNLIFKESFSIYEQLNKIDDKLSLEQRSQLNENFNEVGTYPYMYISNTGDEYTDIMSDEEIDRAYESGQFSDNMWLKSEAHITKEDGSYQVSWGNFDDYHTANSIAGCKTIVKKYHPYGFKWLKDDRPRASQTDRRISTKLRVVREKINSRLYSFVKINNIYKELNKLKQEGDSISPAIYVGLENRIRPLDINVRRDDQRTLLPYTDKIISDGELPCMGIVMYHRKGVEIPQNYIDRLHKIFYDNVTSRDYFRYVGVGERLGEDTLLYQICLPAELTDKINNTALAECGLSLVDNEVVEINMRENVNYQLNKIDDKESHNEKYNVKTLKDLKKLTEAANDKLYRVDIFSYTYSRMNPKPHSQKLMPEEFNTLNDALEFFYRVIKPDQTEYTFLDNTSTSCVEYVRIVSPEGAVEKEWYHPTWGSHHKSKTTNKVKKRDVEKYLKSHQEVELSADEFTYVVNDLWNAIQREVQEGSVYNTIEDVNMSELIDASDNPTHDLCYKLMGLVDDEL